MKMVDKKKQGKQNRQSGLKFERQVRADLEKRGWIVTKWMNNIEFQTVNKGVIKTINSNVKAVKTELDGKIVPAKRKYNPYKRALSIGSGFPDFVAFKINGLDYKVIFVEAKKSKYLDKEEKEKCKIIQEREEIPDVWIAYRATKVGDARKSVIKYIRFKDYGRN